MALVELLELLGIVVLIAGAATQVFIPLARGTVLFPRFRSREASLRSLQAQRRQRDVEAKLEQELKREDGNGQHS